MFLYDDPAIKVEKEDGTVYRPSLDIILNRSNNKPIGTVIIAPGGGYRNLTPHEGGYIAGAFAKYGLHTCILNYRHSPCTFPAPQQDILRAIRILRGIAADCDMAPDQIAVLGFSAGGHLCASCGTKYNDIPFEKVDAYDEFPSNPNAMILCYPVIDLCSDFAHKGSGEKYRF